MSTQCNLVFLMDPIDAINPKKDSTLALMLAAQSLQLPIYYARPGSVRYEQQSVMADCAPITVYDDQEHWFSLEAFESTHLANFDWILVRYEPPFDQRYLYVTQLLQLLGDKGVAIANSPRGLQMINEKLGILLFPEYCAPTLVSSNAECLKSFIQQNQKVIVKPLDGMGGRGIFYLRSDLPNQQATLELLTQDFSQPIMAQRYIPAIQQGGDKRLFILHGQVFPYALIRRAQQGETRANMAAGGQVDYAELTDYEWTMAQAIADRLAPFGLDLLGLDVIGDYLTEINVTCPTGMRELTRLSGMNVAKHFLQGCIEN